MSFGAALASAYQSASSAARKAFDSTVEVAGKTAERMNDLRKKAQQAVRRGIETAVDATKEAANAAAGYVNRKASEVRARIASGWDAVKRTADKIVNAQPAGAVIQECPNRNKKNRVEQRKQKLANAKQRHAGMPDSPGKETLGKAIERFQFNNRAVERARLSHHVYQVKDDPNNPPPQGWSKPTREELEAAGIDPEIFPRFQPNFDPDQLQDQAGFYADIYKSDPNIFGEETYVVAYRGTSGGLLERDWAQNAKQAFGSEAEYYEQSMLIAAQTSSALGDQVEFAGHSLGGGMASAASLSSGKKGYGFNPAGVHPQTLARREGSLSREDAANGPDGKPLVNNVMVRGEMLTKFQDRTLQKGLISAGAATAVVTGHGAAAAAGAAALATTDAGQALRERGTISFDAAGANHEVPPIGNAREVAEKTSSGERVQAMTPSLMGKVKNTLGFDLHGMDYVIAGMEQQKADDLATISR